MNFGSRVIIQAFRNVLSSRKLRDWLQTRVKYKIIDVIFFSSLLEEGKILDKTSKRIVQSECWSLEHTIHRWSSLRIQFTEESLLVRVRSLYDGPIELAVTRQETMVRCEIDFKFQKLVPLHPRRWIIDSIPSETRILRRGEIALDIEPNIAREMFFRLSVSNTWT